MICGTANIWPMPTIKTMLGSQSMTFSTALLRFDVVTRFSDAKNLITQAYDIFLSDLKNLESKEMVFEETNNEHENFQRKKSVGKDEHVEKNCDIKSIDIKVEITTVSEIYHNLDMDESYELNITSKLSNIFYILSSRSFHFILFYIYLRCKKRSFNKR